MRIRKPIVSILGHVDHGKTTLLDHIRGSGVAEREAGKITQHIGATEVPLDTIINICEGMMKPEGFKVPGLLFIDTPGHYAFTSLRSRGGNLADIAVLIVDVMEGLKPQTIESINILKNHKTPFIIALNKIDRLQGWRKQPGKPFAKSVAAQNKSTKKRLEERFYEIIGDLHDEGVPADRFDRISDFTKTIAIVPISAREGEGVPDLLLLLVGLAQRFLEEHLADEEALPGEGTILEVKEEKGLGTTIDTIIYRGSVRSTDELLVHTINGPKVTRIKALLSPKPLDEIRDPRERFDSDKIISAAAGVKIACQDLEGVIAGSPVKVMTKDTDLEAEKFIVDHITTKEAGIFVKGDAIGSLEALSFELEQEKVPIKKVGIGDVSRRDVVEVSMHKDPLFRAILAFNVNILPDAKEAINETDVKVVTGNVIYRLKDDYIEWADAKKVELEEASRMKMAYPGQFKIFPEYIFRVSKPAVVGVRVLAGRLRVGQGILREDGRVIGTIKSIRSGEESRNEARVGEEVAISIPNVTVGRQIKGGDVLLVDLPEADAKALKKMELTMEEEELLEKVIAIKRKESDYWAM